MTQPLKVEDRIMSNYEIDENGTIYRTLKSGKRKIVRPQVISDKYLFVYIAEDRKGKMYGLNKLMLYTFSDIPYTKIRGCHIHHIDGDSFNVAVNNLELRKRKDGTVIRQPRYIQNEETKEIMTTTQLAERSGLSLSYVSNYVTAGMKIRGQLWKEYYGELPEVVNS